MARNWTLAALDDIYYKNHFSRLTFSTIFQHYMDNIWLKEADRNCLAIQIANLIVTISCIAPHESEFPYVAQI